MILIRLISIGAGVERASLDVADAESPIRRRQSPLKMTNS
jgi:hypothetical protein